MTRADLKLAGRWIVARIKLNARNPRAMVFTFAFPLVLVVLFNGLNGNAQVSAPGEAHGTVPFAQFSFHLSRSSSSGRTGIPGSDCAR